MRTQVKLLALLLGIMTMASCGIFKKGNCDCPTFGMHELQPDPAQQVNVEPAIDIDSEELQLAE
jgi:hypothetical protein